jgi:hypothetical protein
LFSANEHEVDPGEKGSLGREVDSGILLGGLVRRVHGGIVKGEADLQGADERDCGQIFDALVLGEGQIFEAVPSWPSEIVRLLERFAAQIEGRTGGKIFKKAGGPVDTELLPAALGFEDALGDEEEASAGFEGLDGGLEGEVGEEAERHGDVSEDAGAVAVAKDGGLTAGVDVGEEAEIEVEAAEKGWCETGPACGVVEGLIELVGQGAEGVHHIDDFGGEELRDAEAKGILRVGGDGVGIGTAAGDVGEEEDEVRPCGDGVEEVAPGARGVEERMKIEAFEQGKSHRQRGAGGLRGVLHGWWRLYFV